MEQHYLILHKTFALFVKRLCIKEIRNAESLESFIASILIPLDKHPGSRLIGVGEVLRRTAGKALIILLRKDVFQAAGLLQLCGYQFAGSEATIYAMHDTFNNDSMKGILLIDADSGFNWNIMLHNLKFIFPVIEINWRR